LLRVAESAAVSAWDGRRAADTLEAKERLEAAGARVTLGGDGAALLDARTPPRCIVKSPGITFQAPLIARALERGLVVIDEAELGWRLDGRPLVAVTGTNGKSTTAALAMAVLSAQGESPALAGNTYFGPALSALDDGAGDVVVVELSSFQLEGCPALLPDVAVFTNLTHEHLDRHRDRRDYGACKRRAFVRGGQCARAAVVNVDDSFGRGLADEVEARGGRVVRYGFGAHADHRVVACDWTLETGVVSIETRSCGLRRLRTRLPGTHNALNIAAAVGLGDVLGADRDRTARAIEGAASVPGRFEPIRESQPFDVIVDYAHNPDGIRSSLETARGVIADRPGARVHAVVSAVAQITDVPQRLAMGRAARELSDHLILTTERWSLEESSTVPPEGLAEGAREGPGGQCEVVGDRRAALELALQSAAPGDVVMILGRGARADRIFDASDRPHQFDDRVEARALLGRIAAERA
jgi:UDP-N-acetylmuramoyl-L-alanyl-D-glutamate--2,6-diaminopimelate ligase